MLIKVWVLIIALGVASYSDGESNTGRTLTIVDNIASAQDCKALGEAVQRTYGGNVASTTCYSVMKVAPQR